MPIQVGANSVALVRASGDANSAALPPEYDAVYVTEEENDLALVFTRPALPQATALTATMTSGRQPVAPDASTGSSYAWRDTRWPASPLVNLRFAYTGASSVAFTRHADDKSTANVPVASSGATLATASYTPPQAHERIVASAANAEGSVLREIHVYYWSTPTLSASAAAFQLPVGSPPVQTEIVRIQLVRGGSPLPDQFTMTASDGSATYNVARHFRGTTATLQLSRAVTGTFSNVTYTFTASNTVPGTSARLSASASVAVAWP